MSPRNKLAMRVDSIEGLRPWIKNIFQTFTLKIHEIYYDFCKKNSRDKLQLTVQSTLLYTVSSSRKPNCEANRFVV